MPLARSWTEELIAQYLEWKGFLIITDKKIGQGSKGGREDIDIVALDPAKKEIKLVNVTNTWSRKYEKIAEKTCNNLSKAEQCIREKYGNAYTYTKELILICYEKEAKSNVIKAEVIKINPKVQVTTLDEYISKIVDEMRKHRAKTMETLPENLYLLKLLEFMIDEKSSVKLKNKKSP